MSIEPHGGKLINRCVDGGTRDKLVSEAASLPRVDLDDRQVSDLDMIAVGAMSPLTGFMGEADYQSVVKDLRLADGTVWPFPMGLRVSKEIADQVGARAALFSPEGNLLAVMDVTEKYQGDKKAEARHVYGTDEQKHPGVAALYEQGEVNLAGDIHMLGRRGADFPQLHADPADLRARFDQLGWKTVVGFQTRNPIHRAHEYLLKCALEIVDGVLIHPLVGATKSDDIPADIRVRCYEALLAHYFPKDRAVLAAYPAAMRYAGPREAMFHALTRKNYGCTHFIVGRDHAGVGDYYGTYDSQKIFEQFTPAELGITLFNFEHAFWCKKSGGMATAKTSDSAMEDRFFLSGTKVRDMLKAGQDIPVEFTRPEVAKILMENARAEVSA
ncbi:MAG: sulfate adenylyltransferase [Gemmatimonadota bacterium]|nr:MAG: sulfate adenylyltransferase [Gemmatimonadota bacterium]